MRLFRLMPRRSGFSFIQKQTEVLLGRQNSKQGLMDEHIKMDGLYGRDLTTMFIDDLNSAERRRDDYFEKRFTEMCNSFMRDNRVKNSDIMTYSDLEKMTAMIDAIIERHFVKVVVDKNVRYGMDQFVAEVSGYFEHPLNPVEFRNKQLSNDFVLTRDALAPELLLIIKSIQEDM